jgi:hypothetical protein
MTMSVVTSISTVGSKKLPPHLHVDRRRACRRYRPGALLGGIGDGRLDLLGRLAG